MERVERECKWCDRGWAVIGFLFGAALILVSIDLLLDGRLSDLTKPSLATEQLEMDVEE